MKGISWLFCLLLLSVFLTSPLISQTYAQENTPSFGGRVIVKFKTGQNPQLLELKIKERETRKNSLSGFIKNIFEDISNLSKGEPGDQAKLTKILAPNKQIQVKDYKQLISQKEKHPTTLSDIFVLETQSDLSTQELAGEYKKLGTVEYAEPDYLVTIQTTPNDSYFSYQWNLTKISIPEAWDITTGSVQNTVAVVDTGISTTHPDLPNGNIIMGYDFVNNDNFPVDDHGHGTHIAGIIGAVTNNALGVGGINWNVKLLAIKVLDSRGTGTTSNIVNGINYAVNNGAKVINFSLGANVPCLQTQSMQDAVNFARQNNITVVVAAGNSNTDAANFSPASCAGVITVGATDKIDHRASYSNYGSVVDLAAPGGGGSDNTQRILSTYINNGYVYSSGTSIATPHVAAAAALLLSVSPNLTPDEIESLLKNNTDTINTDQPIGNRLNVYKAVLAAMGLPFPTPSPTVQPSPSSIPSPTPGTSPQPSASPSPPPVDFGLTFYPNSLNVAVVQGLMKPVMKFTSVTATQFLFYGYPTSRGPGINWHYASGGISKGTTMTQSIQVNSNVTQGRYEGIGVLSDGKQKVSFPVSVLVIAQAGDINGDNAVDYLDLKQALQNYHFTGSTVEDVNVDFKINSLDISWINKWIQ